MVLPFLTMPDDVLAHFARQLSDATTAGRLAQTSRAGDQLMRNRLPELREERQAAAQAAAQAKAAKQRAWCKAVYDCFEASEDGVHYRCIAGNIAMCGTTLRIRGAGKASKLSNHLQRCHPREYGALMTAFESVHE